MKKIHTKSNGITGITRQEQAPFLQTSSYKRLVIAYKEWLQLIGYTGSSVNNMPSHLREFFLWLETIGILSVESISPEHINSYYEKLKQRRHYHKRSLVKISTVNSHVLSLKTFARYLEHTEQGNLEIDIETQERDQSEKMILSVQEIHKLYQAVPEGIAGLRDRAILSLYYGCGLRSNEGLSLDVSDILLEKQILYIRKAKGYKERYVPFTESQGTDFKLYLQLYRPRLVSTIEEQSFLLNYQGQRLHKSSLERTIKRLRQDSNNEILQSKSLSPHVLRHSIATHLLSRGMDIEDIAKFLGHAHLQSTQGYTHLAMEEKYG